MTWKRAPQECEGDHTFSGRIILTKTVFNRLVKSEVADIIADLRAFVAEKGKIDYLQVYENEISGERLFCIDNLSERDKAEDTLSLAELMEHNFYTIMFDHEY